MVVKPSERMSEISCKAEVRDGTHRSSPCPALTGPGYSLPRADRTAILGGTLSPPIPDEMPKDGSLGNTPICWGVRGGEDPAKKERLEKHRNRGNAASRGSGAAIPRRRDNVRAGAERPPDVGTAQPALSGAVSDLGSDESGSVGELELRSPRGGSSPNTLCRPDG